MILLTTAAFNVKIHPVEGMAYSTAFHTPKDVDA